MLFISNPFLLLAGILLSSLVEGQPIPPGCVNITIPVTITAQNLALPTTLDVTDFFTILEPIIAQPALTTVSGTFNIAATYCEPVTTNTTLFNTLQLLVHGATYTKSYWFGEYYSQSNSWVDYASNQGYPTLSIDRLGNGNSEHPSGLGPILDVQDPIHVEIIHTIIGYARRNQLVIPNPRSFMTILLCGHSLGSVISNVLNTKYPSDADAMLLTGFAPILPTNEIGLAAQALLFPADISAPQYAKLSPAYLIFDSRTDFDFLFYYPPETDINMQNRDWATRGTFALGEAATAALPSQVARDYANPVLVVTGSHDSFFCSLLSLDIQFLLGSPNCDTTATGPAASTASLYPNAKGFTYLTPNAGHCWQLHTNAYATFVQVHEWIRSQGF